MTDQEGWYIEPMIDGALYYGPFKDEIDASMCMDENDLHDDYYKIVWRDEMVDSSITLEKEEPTMDHFIVVGVYTDNNNSFAERITAETPEQAIALVAENMRMEPGAEQLLLIGAVPGQTYLAPASEDGDAVYVLDLATQ
jgi:hypothetical protein